MAAEAPSDLRMQLETLLQHGALGSLSDGELLARFQDADGPTAEAAFATLVDRHGPMVLRVCRSALGTTHDAEDASQAVFLVLARRARSVRRRESAASWLYGVARRVAARARRDAARRRKHERRRAEIAASQAEPPVVDDACEGIYAAIDALPEIYRSALVLCYLEGLSHEQAASWLHCPVRTLQSRLHRAKGRLRDRLARRGASLPASIPPLVCPSPPSAAWVKSTAEAAIAFAAGQTPVTSAGVSAATLALASASLRAPTLVPKLIAGVLLAAGLAVAVAIGGINDDPPPKPPGPGEPKIVAPTERDPSNRTLVLQVVDRDSWAPIDGAAVTVKIDSGARAGLGGEPEIMSRSVTDANGRCTIQFPRNLPKEIYITARKSGYADRSYSPLLGAAMPSIPSGHTIQMERGVTVGGTVKSRDGKAVAGATVMITARAGADQSADWTFVPEVTVITDNEGRWSFHEMPSGWQFAYLKVVHPGYVPTAMQREVPQPSSLMLKAKKAETILDEGVALVGKVVDDAGRPLAGARIGLGADRRISQRGFPEVAADADGRFRFAHVPAGTVTVTVQAPGRAPDLADAVVAAGMKPLEFRLGPGHLIRGRVVNTEGKPLDGVTVQAMDWRGHWSLDWTTKTDADGRFIWDSAPAEPVSLTLTRPGYAIVGQREFRTDQGETSVTMYPPLRVRGKVTDAQSGEPIKQFAVLQGLIYRPSTPREIPRTPQWEPRVPWSNFTGGMYEVEYAHPGVMALAVRVEAEGYKPRTSESFRIDAGDVVFDARLELETRVGPSGMVRGPDGRPVAGAMVILSARSRRAQLAHGRFHPGAHPEALTGPDGRFRFPPQPEPFHVFVHHPSGFAEADQTKLAEATHLALQPWGRIEGIVKIGARPAAGVEISLSEPERPLVPPMSTAITQTQRAITDERGHYAFEHVVPDWLSVSRVSLLERSRFHIGIGSVRIVRVKPGRTTFVDLGGTGRPVTGRLVLPADIKPDAVFHYYGQTLQRVRPDPPYPANLSNNERETWLTRWLTTPEGEAYASMECNLDLNVRPDGHYRVEDVPAGRYRLHAQVHEPGNGVPGTYGPDVAAADTEVDVPEMPGGRSDLPLDVGTITMKPTKRPGPR